MNKKINLYANGKFEYEQSVIQCDSSEISLETEAGENISGNIRVWTDKDSVIRGMAVTDCHYMMIENDSFEGKECEIKYTFVGEKCIPGEVIKGNFDIISDCGSLKIPFSISIGVPACNASIGKIKDMFHFANLAREDESEAVALFKNKKFEEVFLYKEPGNIALYRGLLSGTSKGIAMEEFLIAIHKKLPIQFTLDKTNFIYDDCVESFEEEVTITKDNWGFCELHVVSDAKFLQPEHKIIWTDKFSGNSYKIKFLVDVDKMAAGINYGRVMIQTVRQTLVIEVMAQKRGTDHDIVVKSLARQTAYYDLMKMYLEFSMGRIEKKDYILSAEKNLVHIDGNAKKLYDIHLGILSGDNSRVKSGLSYFDEIENRLYETEKINYCAYQYLKALWAEENDIKDECIEKVRACYESEDNSWQILWFLLYLDPVYESDRRKLEDVLDCVEGGCSSPVIYFEMCSALNTSAGALREITPAIIRCLHWGCENEFLSKELALRYVYLAGRSKEFNKVVLRDMISTYARFSDDEVLAGICRMYMRGQKINQEANKWYGLAIEHNLKITELFEYYMDSLKQDGSIKLTKSVLLYFMYDNHLSVSKKAMLYAYIIKNRENDPDTYASYQNIIEDFAFAQIEAGRISENLAVCYEQFLNEDNLTDDVAQKLPDIMFAHEIQCSNPDIVGVYVRHRELKDEQFVPVVNGKAVVQVFTENAQVFLADALDNRYAMSIDYTLNKLLHLDYLADKCFEMNRTNACLLLFMYDKIEHFRQINADTVDVLRRVYELDIVSAYQKRKIFSAMLRYYFDNFEGDLLDEALKTIDWNEVSPGDRKQYIEYCTVRHCYDKAMEGIMLFGYQNIEPKRLLQISSGYFENQKTEDGSLIKLAYHIFANGKFDENMLKYMCMFYNGNLDSMIDLWKAADGFGIDVKELEERIIAQLVFTEEFSPESYSVFYSFYEHDSNRKLTVSFMKMLAYKYLIKKYPLPEKIFEYFYREVRKQDNLPCLIAVLKYFSTQKELSQEKLNFADYNLNKLYNSGKIFPFFKDYYGKFPLPVHILDEHYVEYTANPEYDVKIHYYIASSKEEKEISEDEYIIETMPNVFEGIRVKEFVMFQDEVLKYYITELRDEGEVVTCKNSVHFDETMDNERAGSRFHNINMMLIAQEMNDDKTLVDMMADYESEIENVRKMFKLL
ncbi:DUF5717 family protein [Butyribacter sp.]|uniref:DUF5717 family protein n=1 Tax=Butyribacter sp. TaxID=2822465 RepID=UPI002A93304C|nr:DUF5717 family protein [Butyribacter sp.]